MNNNWQTQAATILIIECKRISNGGAQDLNNLLTEAQYQLTRGLHETWNNPNWYHAQQNQPLFGATAVGPLVYFVEAAAPHQPGGVVVMNWMTINNIQYQVLDLRQAQDRANAATVLKYIRERYMDWWKNIQNVRFGQYI